MPKIKQRTSQILGIRIGCHEKGCEVYPNISMYMYNKYGFGYCSKHKKRS